MLELGEENKEILNLQDHKYPILEGDKIQNKYCKLAIKLAINIIQDYYNQLNEYFLELRNKFFADNLNNIEVANYNNLKTVVPIAKKMITNIEKNIFFGKVQDNYLTYFELGDLDNYGKEIPANVPVGGISKEKLEFDVTREGIVQCFRILAIKTSSLYDILRYSINKLSNKYSESIVKQDLVFNNYLETNLNYYGLRKVKNFEKPKVMTFFTKKFFAVNLEENYKVINEFIRKEISESKVNTNKEKNVIIREIFKNLFMLLDRNALDGIADEITKINNWSLFEEE